MFSSKILEKIQKIKMLITDLDGVLTDGRIWMDANGDWKRSFFVHDGVGIRRLRSAGYRVAIITMSNAEDVRERVNYLEIDYFYENVREKETHFRDLLQKAQLQPDQVAYIGDDVMDMPLLKKCGWAVSVPNGVDDVKGIADYITTKPGGSGAVREVCEILLKHNPSID